MIRHLDVAELRQRCTPDDISRILSNPPAAPAIIGQERAAEALRLGLAMQAEGFNIFVAGDQGTGRLHAVTTLLGAVAAAEPIPPDVCYVYNFADPYQPRRLGVPAGRGSTLRKDMRKLVQEILQSLAKAFESEEYVNRRNTITEKYEKRQSALNTSLSEQASKASLQIRQTPWDIFTVPINKGEPMTDQDFQQLPPAEKERIEQVQERFGEEMKVLIQQSRRLDREAGQEMAALEQEVAGGTITLLIDELAGNYHDLPEVNAHLQDVKKDILDNLTEFLLAQKGAPPGLAPGEKADFLKRYEVNLVVDNADTKGAPVVIEHNPTYNNLVGRVEKESVMGTLMTDFTMIRKGSLLSANGGYLILRAEELLRNFLAWDALKRALRNRQVVVEDIADQLGYITTRSLKPEPLPLRLKVILIGSPLLYHLLLNYDPDFHTLFKVKAEFDTEMGRTEENIAHYAAFAAHVTGSKSLPAVDTNGLAGLVEFGSRLADDNRKLSTRFEVIIDLLQEAGHLARTEGAGNITDKHIRNAVRSRWMRSNLVQEKFNELVSGAQIRVETRGQRTGQLNGLSVTTIGDLSLGRPTRITSTVTPGKAGVVAIEREAEMSGPIHTKGVLILSGYLAEKYFPDKPVSLTARIVFEQSYAEVEGDSASSTELYALLSNLSGLPIKQGIAVTGSVDQKGMVQAIGGVNEKIEGYFDLCSLLGLDGSQGVMIPSANLANLMLREEVVEAAAAGRFHVWAVDTIEDGIELLTGVRAGTPSEEGTVNHLVNRRLEAFSKSLQEHAPPETDRQESTQWVSDVV